MATKAKKTEEDIKLPALAIKRIKVRVRGLSSLITNKFSEKSKRQMAEKQQGKIGPRDKKPPKDPVADFNAARYVIDGKDAFPALCMKKAIMAAAVFQDGAYKNRVGMAVFVLGSLRGGEFIEIKGGKPNMREDTVRNASGVADLRYRPEYADWYCDFEIVWNESYLSAEQVLNLLKIAGFSCGVCEWRPEKGGGPYGRFEIDMKGVDAKEAA
jgi:hypothetical protein